MLNIGKLCLDTDFDFRVIREEDNDIDLFIDINYRSVDIYTNKDSFFNSKLRFKYSNLLKFIFYIYYTIIIINFKVSKSRK